MAEERLPSIAVVTLPPRADALEQVRHRAGQLRRRKSRAAAAATGVAATLVLLVAWQRGGGRQSLEPVRPMPAPVSATAASSTPLSTSVGVRPHDAVGRSSSPGVVVAETSSATPPLPSPLGPSFPSAGFSDGALTSAYFGPPAAPDGVACTATPARKWSRGPRGWCLALLSSAPTGEPDIWQFGAIMCRLVGSGPGLIRNDQLPRVRVFDAVDEDVVFDSARHPWTSPGQAGSRARTWAVEEGGCEMFFSPWASIDSNGAVVDEGSYRYDWDPTDTVFDAWAAEHTGEVITVHPGVDY
jgi:hypothetical protein